MIRNKGKTWLTRLVAGAGGLLAAALSLGYSLYEQRESDLVRQVQANTSLEAGRWKVLVTGSRVSASTPDGLQISKGKRAILVNMILENISAESSNLYGTLIRIANMPDVPRPQYYLVRDRAILWDLQPRMPELVVAVWEFPETSQLPDVLKLQVEGERFKPRDNLYSAPGWFPAGAVATMSLPLKRDIADRAP